MNSERDRIIERYINGDMRPEEEAEFKKLLEVDPELKRMFRAESIVHGTMIKERAILQGADHSQSYSRFLMGLAASVPVAGGVTAAGVGAAGSKLGVLAKLGMGTKALISSAVIVAAGGSAVVLMQPTEPARPAAVSAPHASGSQRTAPRHSRPEIPASTIIDSTMEALPTQLSPTEGAAGEGLGSDSTPTANQTPTVASTRLRESTRPALTPQRKAVEPKPAKRAKRPQEIPEFTDPRVNLSTDK